MNGAEDFKELESFHWFDVNECEKDSGKTHTREERNRCSVVLNEPLKVLLKDILARHTKCRKKCIEAGLCGMRLPTTIEQFDPGFAYPSDQITVQIDIGTVGISDHLRVRNFQILIVTNCIDDLSFDLTHGWLE